MAEEVAVAKMSEPAAGQDRTSLFKDYLAEPRFRIRLFESLRWATPQKCKRGLWRVTISHMERDRLESVHGAMVQTRQVRVRQGDGFRFVIEEGKVE